MPGFRGQNPYAGTPGADLENAPQGPVPFTSPFGIPVTRLKTWHAGGVQPGASSGGVPGSPVQHTSGNPSTSNVPGSIVQSPYGGMQQQGVINQTGVENISGPGAYQETFAPNQGNPNTAMRTGIPQFGQRVLQQGQETAVRAPGNAPVGYSNDKLVTYDRHGIFKVGYENSGRNSGETDPPLDGPARPSLWLVQRTLNYQQGTDTTGATDDLTRDYTRNASGMYVGEQGTGWGPVYGGTPGLYQTYGSYQGIAPDTPGYNPETGQTQGIVSPVQQGQPGDGPHSVWSGPPHGLHSPTLPDYAQTIGRYMSIPQMARPRIDRPSNSPIAGQSYSQTVQSQGGSVGGGQTMTRGASFNRGGAGNGWRGRKAGG
jgi:hypothetical protein